MRQADTCGRVRGQEDRGTGDPAGGTMRMSREGMCTKADRNGKEARRQESKSPRKSLEVSGWDSELSLLREWVEFLVRELKSFTHTHTHTHTH